METTAFKICIFVTSDCIYILCVHVYRLYTQVGKHINMLMYDMHSVVCNRQICFLNVKHCWHSTLAQIWL